MSLFDVCKKSLTSSLYHNSHCFYFKSKQINVLENPTDFYTHLKDKIKTSQNRIFIASLYLGKKEQELINCLSDAMKKNTNLKLYFIVDGLRGTRESPNPCSASLLASLVQKYGNRVDVRCYRAPQYFRWYNKLLPSRINEGVGLQHMKIYGFDDEVILSGANLSNDYFTDRQDRYYIFKNNKFFTDYYFKIHQLVSKLSYKVVYRDTAAKFELLWPVSNISCDPKHNRLKFVQESKESIKSFMESPVDNLSLEDNHDEYPSYVYPLTQLSPFFKNSHEDASTEKKTLMKLFEDLKSSKTGFNWKFTTGYFNIERGLRDLLIETSANENVSGKIITASAKANGFYLSKGVSGLLPDAYHHLQYKFLKLAKSKNSNISIDEWAKGQVNTPNGWSYHAKGIWILPKNNDAMPILTTIGSSNYTTRAYTLDIESDCVILTKDKDLRQQIQGELDNLYKNVHPVKFEDFAENPEKKVKLHVKLATKVMEKKL